MNRSPCPWVTSSLSPPATFFRARIDSPAILGDEHKTVALSILATVVAAFALFATTVAISGGLSITLFKSYVLPLFMSAFTLSIFWVFLFARHKGKIPMLEESEVAKERSAAEQKAAPQPDQ